MENRYKIINEEWIEYNKTFKEFLNEGLCQRGILIELTGGIIYLIGDLNINGGIIDKSVDLKGYNNVLRYKKIIEII